MILRLVTGYVVLAAFAAVIGINIAQRAGDQIRTEYMGLASALDRAFIH